MRSKSWTMLLLALPATSITNAVLGSAGEMNYYGLIYTVEDDKATVVDYDGAESRITIPESIEGHPVVAIGDDAFREIAIIENIVLPETVTRVGDHAFRGCSLLVSVTLPEGLQQIGEGAFAFSRNLSAIVLPEAVTTIPEDAFRGCSSLSSVTLSSETVSIGRQAFADTESLTHIDLPATLQTLGGWTFKESGLVTIEIPGSVAEIPTRAFYWCRDLETVIINAGTEVIGRNAFWRCSSLVTLDMGPTVVTIEDESFEFCSSLADFTFSPTVTRLADSAFRECTGLRGLYLPPSLAMIERGVFVNCTLEWLVFTGNKPASIHSDAIAGTDTLASLYRYEDSRGWFSDDLWGVPVFEIREADLWTPYTVDPNSGWRKLDWFGWYFPSGGRWNLHAEHGYQHYVVPEGSESVFFYDQNTEDWFWTSESLYPALYKYGANEDWYWFWQGSVTPNRWFTRIASDEHIAEAEI